MRMRGVDHHDVDLGVDQRTCAIEAFLADADRRAAAQAAQRILRGLRIAPRFLNVLDGDEALEIAIRIDDQKFFDAMLM